MIITSRSLIAWGLFLVMLPSCVPYETMVNFNQGPAYTSGQPIGNIPELRIQPDDLLEITVSAPSLAVVQPFVRVPSAMSSEEGGAINAYLVDGNGEVVYPSLGRIPVAGLTIADARDTLRNRLLGYLRDPVVDVRFLNFRVTVLGEVNLPSTYTLPDNRVTVLEALGLAGDLTIYANRENVLIVREQNGIREFGRINLRDRRVFESPYFYLQQNDVIYIEPIEQKVGTVTDRSTRVLPWVSLGTVVLNLGIILATQLRR